MLIEYVLNDQLDADILQIVVRRLIARVVTERQIEAIEGRQQVVVPAVEARERSTCRGPKRCRRTEIAIDVRRRTLRVVVVAEVVHEPGDIPRSVAPAEAATIVEDRKRRNTNREGVVGARGGMESVGFRCARRVD